MVFSRSFSLFTYVVTDNVYGLCLKIIRLEKKKNNGLFEAFLLSFVLKSSGKTSAFYMDGALLSGKHIKQLCEVQICSQVR